MIERRQVSSRYAKPGRFLLISLRVKSAIPAGQQTQTQPPDEKPPAFRASGVGAHPAFRGRGCEGCRGIPVTS